MKKEFAGIDVSKLTLDVSLYHRGLHGRFSNDLKGFESLFNWLLAQGCLDGISFCFEHTGIYSRPLAAYLQAQHACFYMVSGLAVKRSMGLKRGKSDKSDAQALARYAYQHRDELTPTVLAAITITELRDLLSLRLRIVRELAGHKTYLKEQEKVLQTDPAAFNKNVVRALIEVLKETLKSIEEQIARLIKEDGELQKVYTNLISIKGVGPVLTWTMIAITNNFQSFKEWRKLACYAGIAPFEHSSGTSYRGRTRVSHLGNSYLKSLLTQGAASAIQHSAEMKVYYHRRVQEGKSKMSTLNIIRNKLVSRMFAVAKRGTPYVETYKFAA